MVKFKLEIHSTSVNNDDFIIIEVHKLSKTFKYLKTNQKNKKTKIKSDKITISKFKS